VAADGAGTSASQPADTLLDSQPLNNDDTAAPPGPPSRMPLTTGASTIPNLAGFGEAVPAVGLSEPGTLLSPPAENLAGTGEAVPAAGLSDLGTLQAPHAGGKRVERTELPTSYASTDSLARHSLPSARFLLTPLIGLCCLDGKI
jgi:hypothetical protein